ncbi:Protein CBG01956 [Caenorhabditis briggsae]|uniref:Tetraspanin n=2 Tax=Caenorhabditis briggsae TaxID=6238 RepID=A8WRP0_CAEBR|nr:Protein CBG01956 [Caenorhabditis briggsae]ULT80462.1 hypothetical protein L3Y34_010789 [Caenorhabditis briggsae]CAP23148.2 Protein CBG01956 [Caenorhabditis briggsae]
MAKIDLNKIWNDNQKISYFFYTNVCFLISGFASFVVGVWLYSSKNNFVELTPSSYSALSAAGLCVFTGVTICIIVAVGYLGVSYTNKPLFYSYIAFILLLILAHGTARTTGFLHKDEARENLRTSMLRNINATVVITKLGRELKLALTWDHLQRELECCGVNNYTDWYYSVHWPNNQYTPDSCCEPIHFQENSTMENCGKMPDDDTVLYQEGCFPKFADWLYHHITLVNWVTSVLFIVEVTLFILSLAVLGVLKRRKTKRRRSPRRERDPDVTSERIRLNSMDRIADARLDGESINSR